MLSRFEEVSGDDPEIGAKLRIEERELEREAKLKADVSCGRGTGTGILTAVWLREV